MMTGRFVAMLAATFLACAGLPRELPGEQRGTIVLDTIPNPLVALPLGDDEYEMRFEIVMREEGGVDTTIEEFTISALGPGGIVVRTETHPSIFITSRGYPASVEAGKYLSFDFVKRWRLPTPILLAGTSISVSARTVDVNGRRNTTVFRAPVDLHRGHDPQSSGRR